MSGTHESIFLPALRATMGDWVYYISAMEMKNIASRISVIEDIHSSNLLKEWLQRGLTKNAERIKEYLLTQEQRLFNAIVVGSYGGSPNWHDMSIAGRHFSETPDNVEGVMGLLELRGDEKLFAIDGQHRVEGIKGAITKDRTLANEMVCTIFVTGVIAKQRKLDPEGYARTRRLFSTLNRFAKPVSKRDIIALDEDDVVAIVTRQLLENHPLLVDKIDMGPSSSIRTSDKKSLTTIVTLYDVVNVILRDRIRGWTEFKRWRPSESEIEKYYDRAARYWDALCQEFDSLQEFRNSCPEDCVAGKYRTADGGNLLFRPVGMMLIARVVVDLASSGVMEFDSAVKAIACTPTSLSEPPWLGLLWDSANGRMLTAKENQRVARQLLFFALGGDLSERPFKTSKSNVERELGGLLNADEASVALPSYLNESDKKGT